MSVQFIVNGEFVAASTAKDRRILQAQYAEVTSNRVSAETAGIGSMTSLAVHAGFVNGNASQAAINEQVDLMYREVDNMPIIERNATGYQSTLKDLLASAKPTNIGKKVVKKRRVGEAGIASVSMSGQNDIKVDHTNSDYQGAIIPIFDGAYGLDWRDRTAALAEGWDQTVDDSREVEKTVMQKANDFLWDGDSDISFDGVSWNGLKGNQQGISQYTLTADLSSTATTGQDIVNEILAVFNVLRINNDCDGPYNLKVSREIMSNWRRYGSANDANFGTILEMVRHAFPEIASITEDPKLSGNEVFMALFGDDGLHAKSGMAMSSYALPRLKHSDPFDFVKWMAVGFMANETKSGKDCAVYASQG